MAELGKPYPYNNAVISELARCLSDSRFEPYLKRAERDREFAMHSYLYNSRLAKAMLFPLHACEIVLRNAVNDVLKQDFSQAWYRNSSLTNLLAPKTKDMLDRAIESAGSNNVDDIVAELQLGFWYHLLRSNHFTQIWKDRFSRVARADPAVTFDEFGDRLQRVHRFRNRIAHHEGILALPGRQDVSTVHKDIEFLVGAISKEALTWLDAHSTLAKMLRTKPTKKGVIGPTVGERCDNRFTVVGTTTALSELSLSQFTLVEDAGRVTGVISAHEIASFVLKFSHQDGIFELSAHSVGVLLDHIATAKKFAIVSPEMPLSELSEQLSKKRHAVVVSPSGAVKGVIEASHRRY
ncbi:MULTISPECIES: CBS domain-containing protein [Xanthomonas]|uniref:Uncharacterized protein n=1 Tax=Xanthomonas campestris pv. campestris (strain 8004) TaxID=314565 RepID=A0A0H2X9Z6_XANC8|nr:MULTISPECIES: CBS domain-containing protein [Xanthomonas]AAY49479.1 conserved hypothetical protein [Xanthomonas campestris pv. campestris str. 8004]MBD8246544.1 CBS domain-containing protein [Xanthomonas campestris]MDM7703223.1 CBS domain-containing protein [Xanthomonas campestris pv. campestris]MDM7879752.1 CBS domain-containing protein [Xanthomonas campestris pv. campestris]MDO0857509.1 CBS domain-containing protein [Xanthomonas campestris pv. campestris]